MCVAPVLYAAIFNFKSDKKSIEDKKKAAATAAAQANHSMWSHVIKWSHGVEIVYEAKDGKRILTKAYFPFDPEVCQNQSYRHNLGICFLYVHRCCRKS